MRVTGQGVHPVQSDAIGAELQALAARAREPLRAVVRYTVQGGKRVRGLLLIAAGEGLATMAGRLTQTAAVVELLHAATLVQDDIFDRSSTRRGRAAAHHAFDPRLATLASDWMLTEAIRGAYRCSFAFGEALSTCAQRMMAGEARELTGGSSRNEPALRAHALAVSIGKTGELFGLATSAAALLSGDVAAASRLHDCGRDLGLAFQYADDVLDLYGAEPVAGKDLSRDLGANLCTLPVLDALPLLPSGIAGVVLQRCAKTAVYGELQRPQVREYLIRKSALHWEAAVQQLLGELPQAGAATLLLKTLAPSVLPGVEVCLPADFVVEAGRPAA